MGSETLGGPGGPDEVDAGPFGEYPADVNDIVGSRTVPAPGVKSDEGFREAVQGSGVRTLVADLLKHGIHSEPVLNKAHEITIYTSRNKAKLAGIATAAVVVGAAYALRKRHQRKG